MLQKLPYVITNSQLAMTNVKTTIIDGSLSYAGKHFVLSLRVQRRLSNELIIEYSTYQSESLS